MFTQLVDLWSRPTLSSPDLTLIRECGVSFYEHFEKEYYRYVPERIGLSKLTMHMLLHVRYHTELHGPLVNCSQFWVEKYIGYVKNLLNARAKAAESLTSNAIMLEGYKLFYGHHFQEGIANSLTERPMRSPSNIFANRNRIFLSFNMKSLLTSYICSTEGLSPSDAAAAVFEDDFLQHSGYAMGCGEDVVVVGSKLSVGTTRKKKRADYYISAEYQRNSSTHESSSVAELDVYYGRVLAIFMYNLLIRGKQVERELFLADRVSKLRVKETNQVL